MQHFCYLLGLTCVFYQQEERSEKLAALAQLEETEKDLDEKLSHYAASDPALLADMQDDTREALEHANRWTDNIYEIKSWATEKFNMQSADFDKFFGIKADFDYFEVPKKKAATPKKKGKKRKRK
eukprot:TRINITY_DN2396_c0_g1_i1.p2 TRINITY_DN2396_c0_g1~~TRINITY_DN2396_c0_g1_i1.p2  ORF type:complete len:125 (+),score=36.85 TRINITY_DN2396_c0_g1_i1:485-859(+)